MKPQTFIFFGRSGCGKGTQLKLLRDYLNKEDKNRNQFAFCTGDGFREFFNKGTYSSNLAKAITARGELQPLFLTISLWGNAFLDGLELDDHVFIDGYPRRDTEALVLDSALKFYQRNNVTMIDFIVSRETSKKRMLLRGRADDTEENAETR
jgi:adenylate kinase family enzyme